MVLAAAKTERETEEQHLLDQATQLGGGGRNMRWTPARNVGRIPARLLLFGGVLMFPLYVAMDVIASLAYDGYSYADQTISELSAIDAPTRRFWLVGSVFYQVLAFSLAAGVLRVAGESRRLRVMGWLLLTSAVVGLLWWIAPMHQRDVLADDGGTWQDTMHLVVGGMSSILFFAMITVGAFAFGRGLRWYSIATFAALIVFGAAMSMQTAAVGEDEPTPWLGIEERIAVEGAILWQSVFAAVLLLEMRPEPLRRENQARRT